MADEAFALSPINARPSLPTDADYDAIHEAFMETARGRWFLAEYAKRNRNSDTRMVLDAVERIEASLASQRQAQAEAEARAITEARAHAEAQAEIQAEAQIVAQLWPELSKALTKSRIEIAQRLVREDHGQAFESIRTAVETIKSVAWALRERGFDARICDFLDIQVNAIADGYTALMAEVSVAGEAGTDVLAAFDALSDHVETLTIGRDAATEALDVVVDAVAGAMSEDDDDGDAVMAVDDGTVAYAAPAPAPEEPATTVEAAPGDIAANPYAGFHEIYGDDSDIEIVDVAPIEQPPPPAGPTEPEINKQRLYEAKLEPYRSTAAVADAPAQDPTPAHDIEIVDVTGPDAECALTSPAPFDQRPAQFTETRAPPADPRRDKPASLGQALIANGVVHPAGHRPDPLAPFRRMSQAEKVALFT